MTFSPQNESGFTAIELLITLIIASMFLFAGYQLYTQVQRDGADANRAASVSGLTVNRLQSVARTLSGTCASTLETQATVNEPGVGSVLYKQKIDCPNPTGTPNLKLIRITAEYQSNPTRSVTHAIYAE